MSRRSTTRVELFCLIEIDHMTRVGTGSDHMTRVGIGSDHMTSGGNCYAHE